MATQTVRIQIGGHRPGSTVRGWMLVDAIDGDLADHKWSISGRDYRMGRGYAGRLVKRDGKTTRLLAHRVILERMIGRELLRYELTDHRHHNTLDNRRSELRMVDNSKNMQNRSKLPRHNKSGFRGVCWSKKERKWIAAIVVQKRNIRIGAFDNASTAGAAAAAARKRHGFLE